MRAEDVSVEVNAECEAAELFVARHAQMVKARAGAQPPLLFLWHGCAEAVLPEVLRKGFKTSFANMSFNVYGAGIYFATDARLSAFFVTRDVRSGAPLPPDASGRYSLVFAAVALGRTGVREALVGGNEAAKALMAADLKHPANRNPPIGCDSAAGSHLKEVVVYENALAHPLARVSFRLAAAEPLPDPYAQDLALGRHFLRSLCEVPRGGLGRIFAANGCATSLDAAEPEVEAGARLVMGWSAAARPPELSGAEMLERIAALEGRVAHLEDENARLRLRLRAAGGRD